MKGDSALQGVFSNTEGYLCLSHLMVRRLLASVSYIAWDSLLAKDNPVPGATAQAEEPCAWEPCCIRVSVRWTSVC